MSHESMGPKLTRRDYIKAQAISAAAAAAGMPAVASAQDLRARRQAGELTWSKAACRDGPSNTSSMSANWRRP